MRTRLLLVPLVALVALLAGDGVAGSQSAGQVSCVVGGSTAQYPPAACSLRLTKTRVRVGEALDVIGANFAPNLPGTLELRPNPRSLGAVQVGADGTFTRTVTIPNGVVVGPYSIVCICPVAVGRTVEVSANLEVIADPAGGTAGTGGTGGAAGTGGTSSPTSGLGRTGAAMAIPLGIAGVLLVAVGAVAVGAARRRRAAG